MSMDLRELYQDIILDHGRHPRNFHGMPQATNFAHGHNPLCGDKVTVYLKLEGDRIADVSFEGRGCAISTASASLMTEAVKGRTRAEALATFERVHRLLTDDSAPVDEQLGKLAALSGVREFPARVKCASLCWHTLASALQTNEPQALPAVSTE